MAKETKPRKFVPKEYELLRKLEKERRDRQLSHNEACDLIDRALDVFVGDVTRKATETVRDVNEVYQGEKKQIDKWKDSEHQRIDREYPKRLQGLRGRKSFSYQWVEAAMDEVKGKQTCLAENDKRQLEEKHNVFLVENQAAQEKIRGKAVPKMPEKPEKPEKRSKKLLPAINPLLFLSALSIPPVRGEP